jgi:hypothetical protein
MASDLQLRLGQVFTFGRDLGLLVLAKGLATG